MDKTAILLGAGASKAEGSPLQGELFKEYFSSPAFSKSYEEMDRELATFFLLMFNLDVDSGDIESMEFPTFEEALGLTDLAAIRNESFRGFSIENMATNSGRIRFIAQYLVFLVAKLLDTKLQGGHGIHGALVNTLYREGVIRDVTFISTNYDILIDNALTELYNYNIDLDYGVDFRNFDRQGDWRKPKSSRSVDLFKPHGSLNWLYCPTCNVLEITPKEKGVVTKLITDFQQSACPECDTVYMPLIVPPTFYKDMSSVFLSSIWNKAENALRKAKHIIFCGYSFPDADIHIKYLLKRAQVNRATGNTPLRFTVINNYPNKAQREIEEEKYRFQRFLGDRVQITSMSFEEFANDPMPVLT